VAIVICHDHNQFIGFRSLKPVAPQWIWLFQEALTNDIRGEGEGPITTVLFPEDY